MNVVVPSIGIAMTEATVLQWLKQPGDAVHAGDAVVEIETDKAATELVSEVVGTLGAHRYAEGDQAPVGAVLTEVIEAGPEVQAQPGGNRSAQSAQAASLDAHASQTEVVPSHAGAEPAPPSAPLREPHALSPRQRRLAREAASESPSPPAGDKGSHRALIAAKTTEAWQTIPHFGVTSEIDAEPLQAALAAARQAHGDSVTYTDLLVRALAVALRATRDDDDPDIAIAVDTPRGVANPVLRHVLSHGIAALAAARAGVVQRARTGALQPTDLGGASSTLSNLGKSGVDFFTGVITPGQESLVTVGAIRPRPFVVGQVVVPRPTAIVTVLADHRRIDGAAAADLLQHFVNALNTPEGQT